MYELRFSLGPGYSAFIGSGAIERMVPCAKEVFSGRRVFIVADEKLLETHSETCRELLSSAGYSVWTITLPGGDAHKNLRIVEEVYGSLYSAGATREEGIIGLGGGVVLDIAGFAAATYLRGMRFISVPTTIIAQTDSAYGGKTGVDFMEGKNHIGLFSHPKAVICDTDLLKTLPERERICGMGEIIKYGAISDPSLLEGLGSDMPGEKTVFRCASIKKRFVEADEFDTGVRRILNFGHTIGHAIEADSGYEVSHGQAVAYGMLAAARLGERLGVTGDGVYHALYDACSACGLDVSWEERIGRALNLVSRDKKSDGSRIDFILLERLGRPVRMKLTADEIRGALTGEWIGVRS